MAARMNLLTDADKRRLAEEMAQPAMGPDQAWRDFTKVSTIYNSMPKQETWQYSDPNAEKAPEANPDASWKQDFGKLKQSRLESLVEASVSVATGFIISWLMWMYVVAPLFGIPAEAGQALGITLLFTITSVARSYIWRRFFNASIHKRIHSWLK